MNKKLAVAGVGALLAAAAGAYMYANSIARDVARDRVTAALDEMQIASFVSYRDISATVFGEATLHDVLIDPTGDGTWPVAISELVIDDVDTTAGDVPGFSAETGEVQIDVLSLNRSLKELKLFGRQPLKPIVSYGYDRLVGHAAFRLADGAREGAAGMELSFDIAHLGAVKLNLELGRGKSFLRSLFKSEQFNPLALLFGGERDLIQAAAKLALDELAIAIDVGDGRLAWAQVALEEDLFVGSPDSYLDSWQQEGKAAIAELAAKSGLPPEKSSALAELVADRIANGGTIRITKTAAQPVKLFESKEDRLPKLVDTSLAGFMTRAGIEID
jgi:hypothetical protein